MAWRVTLLGKVEATREGTTLSRFESSRAVALLARLALYPRRVHPREELIELLWPEVDPEVARGRLRRALMTLRGPLEAGLPPGSVLIADRSALRVNPEALSTDVAAFEDALARRDLAAARALYAGELMPGLWDEWIVAERHRLEALAAPLHDVPSTAPAATAPGPSPVLSAPPYLTAFVGREAERESLGELLRRARLVTLTGLGGTGKTRLAAETLRAQTAGYDLTAFVSLAECVAAEQIPGRLRAVLGLPAHDADPLEQVCWRLAETRALLALDNLEQLVERGGAALIEALLARLPGLTVLVTSRRALGVAGERLFPLDPLPEGDALALFVDRVQATRPGFRVTDGNRDDVEAVCRGLEGIPLALELAAARIRAFSPAEMRRELDRRFHWIARTGRSSDKDDRHRSLAAALEWSWRLLPLSQQRFLAALALFRAPWTTAEAAAVSGCGDARERLEALAADSLVTSDDADGETRFAQRETVREFALGRLVDRAGMRTRFRRHFLDHPTRDENTPTAWGYALEEGAAGDAYAFAAHRDLDWTARLGVARARALLEQTLDLPHDDPLPRLRVAHRLAQCLLRINERQAAIASMDAAVAALTDAPGDVLAEALSCQAHIGLYDAPQEKTLGLLERCLELTDDPFQRAEALRMKGCLLCWTPAYEDAQPLFDAAQDLYGPDDPGQDRLLLHRAHLERRRRRFDAALDLYQRCAERALQTGDATLRKVSRSNVADILACLGRWEDALVQSRECIEIEEAYGDRHNLVTLLWNAARPLLEVGQAERAAQVMSAAAALWVREVRPLSDDDREEMEGVRADLARALDASTLDRNWAAGEKLTLKEALALVR